MAHQEVKLHNLRRYRTYVTFSRRTPRDQSGNTHKINPACRGSRETSLHASKDNPITTGSLVYSVESKHVLLKKHHLRNKNDI